MKALRAVMSFMPLIFAFGFLTPVIAQGIQRSGWTPPFGANAMLIALVVAGVWGGVAQVRGRWL